MPLLNSPRRIFVAGHKGMVGGAILRALQKDKKNELITRSREELDLLDQAAVRRFMQFERPDLVVVAAAKVGGIHANNTYPADFIYQNLMIECNVIHEAFSAGVERLLMLGSSCIYPRDVEQPIPESALLSGPLEKTNEPYAIAKIAGLKLCQSYTRQYDVDFRSVMPSNLYGPEDNFHPDNSHVIPALIRRFHEAKKAGAESVRIWGTGKPRREFLYVDDLADACVFILDLQKKIFDLITDSNHPHLNIGSGTDVTILDLALLIAKTTGFKGEIATDASKPDGTPRKVMSIDRLESLGWSAKTSLDAGIKKTYAWFLNNENSYRDR